MRGKARQGKAGLGERTAKKGRKKGKETEVAQKKYKNTLDKKMRFTRYSHRASNCLPPVRTFRRSSPTRTPEKTSARSTGVGTNKQRRAEHASQKLVNSKPWRTSGSGFANCANRAR